MSPVSSMSPVSPTPVSPTAMSPTAMSTTPPTGPGPRRVLSLDVGGTVLKGGVFAVDESGVHRLSTLRRPTPRAAGPAAVVAAVLATLTELHEQEPAAVAAGLVVPGVVDEAAGVAVESENLLWRDVPFARLAAGTTGLPVAFGHDVRAGGRAELAALTAPGEPAPREALVLLIGTGIAGLMVVGGVVLPGTFVGEIGHLPVGPEEPCACGSTGCLETISSAASIARRYAEGGGAVVAGARQVLELATGGDPLAQRVWDEAVGGLARALAGYATLLAPELIVVGGGLGQAGEALLVPLRAQLAARLRFQPRPVLRAGLLGDDAGGVGAALLARDLVLRTAYDIEPGDGLAGGVAD